MIFSANQVSNASSTSIGVNNLTISYPEKNSVNLEINLTGAIQPVKAEYVDKPSRLFFDLPGTVLKYNNGRTKRIQCNSGDLKAVAISQYQTNPDIVRIVLYFDGGDTVGLKKATKTSIDGNKFTISFSKSVNPDSGKKTERPENANTGLSRIEKILFRSGGQSGDTFYFNAMDSFDQPEVEISKTGATLNFRNANFIIPSGNGSDFSVPVNSKVLEDVVIHNQESDSVVFMRFKESDQSFTYGLRWIKMGRTN